MSVAGTIGREASNAVIKSNSDSKAADQLDELVLEMNRDLPRFLDAETRLDKVHREHKTLVSSHTIVNYKSNEVDPSLIEQNVKETTKGNVCETARLYLQGGYSYRYIYYGNLGSKITEISLNARDCGFTVR